MSKSFLRNLANLLTGLRWPVCLVLLIGALVLPEARADFVAPYDIKGFSLFNSAFANGTVDLVGNGAALMLTGPHGGTGDIGIPAYTDLTIASVGSGIV